jgi:hypothetical protein
MPNNIKKVEEYKPYKRKLKSFLTEQAFYSLDEFLMLWRNGIVFNYNLLGKLRGLFYISVLMSCGCKNLITSSVSPMVDAWNELLDVFLMVWLDQIPFQSTP